MANRLEMTQEQMYDTLTANYRRLGERFESRLIPIGAAFQRVLQMEEAPAIATARYDHLDWHMALHSNDTRHASEFGKYLASATLFEFLFGEPVVGNPFIPSDRLDDGEEQPWDESDLRFLQTIAHEVVDRLPDSLAQPDPAPVESGREGVSNSAGLALPTP